MGTTTYVIHESRCVCCLACEGSCPTDAITTDKKRKEDIFEKYPGLARYSDPPSYYNLPQPMIDPDLCIHCGECIENSLLVCITIETI